MPNPTNFVCLEFSAVKKHIPAHVYTSWDQSEPTNTSDVDPGSQESDSEDPVSEAWDNDIIAAASTGVYCAVHFSSIALTDDASLVVQCGQKRRSVSLSDAAETPEHRHFKKTKFGEHIWHYSSHPKLDMFYLPEHSAATDDCLPTFPVPDLQNPASSDSETGSDDTTRPPLRPRDRVPSQRRTLHAGSYITPPCPFVLYTLDEVRLWGRVQGQDVDGKLYVNPWSSEYTMKADFNLLL